MQIDTSPKVLPIKSVHYTGTGNVETTSDVSIQDVVHVSDAPAPSRKGLLASAGAAFMVAMSIGGVVSSPAMANPPAISMTVDTNNAARNSFTLAPLSDDQAKTILGQMKDIKDTSFGSGITGWFSSFTPDKALKRINGNGAVEAPRTDGKANDSFSSKEQLAEVAVMRGIYPHSGVPDGIVHAFQAVEKSGGFGDKTAWQAFDALRHGKAVDVRVGGRSYNLSSPGQVQELNALEGNGQDSPLSPATVSLLKRMAEQTPNEGFYHKGRKLNAYEFLQAVQSGQPVTYNFTGGPYQQPIQLPATLADLAKVQQTATNQHVADAVRPSQAFFEREMHAHTAPMQGLIELDAQRAQGIIDGAKGDIASHQAAAQREADAIPAAQAAVERAQANYDATLPGWRDASQRADGAQQDADLASRASTQAHDQETRATNDYQAAQAALRQAREHLTLVLNPPAAPQQAPADPDAAPQRGSQAPADPDAKPRMTPPAQRFGQAPADPDARPRMAAPMVRGNQAPADPDARPLPARPGMVAPADPDAGGSTVSNLQIMEKARAQAAVNAADHQVKSTYEAMRQAIAARVTADIQLAQVQSRLPQIAETFRQADGVKSRAQRELQAAVDVLQGHRQSQDSHLQAASRAQDQVKQGEAALERAHQLRDLATGYVAKPDLATLKQMRGLAVNADLQSSFTRQEQLLNAMSRPAPPAGYQEPTPLVFSEQ